MVSTDATTTILATCSLNDGDVVRNADLYVFNHEVANGQSFIRLIMRQLRDIHVWLRVGDFV